ncbi:MAG: RluA family pseudouridine synthase [Cyanobacteria bacterium P01_A01_bin.83]
MNQGWIYWEQIKAADAGETVLEYYSQKYRHSSQQEWQAKINSGQILLNGKPATTATVLQIRDQLAYHRQPWIEPEVPLNFATIYEDSELLLINKPSGLPVLPGGGFLEHTLLWHLKKRYSQNIPVPVHRLGRGTSGLMLLARSQEAKSHLAQQMRDSTIGQKNSQLNKVYRVLVSGNLVGDRLSITQPIGKIPHPVLGYIYGATPQGKHAHSESQVIERYQNCTLIEVKIFTGRPHQIRIHLAAAGYPLLGDPLYVAGGTFAKIDCDQKQIPVPGDCGYFLHAYRLSFVHPQTLQQMSFKSPVPKAWQTARVACNQ